MTEAEAVAQAVRDFVYYFGRDSPYLRRYGRGREDKLVTWIDDALRDHRANQTKENTEVTTRDKIALGTGAAGVAVVAGAATEVIRRTTGHVILSPREVELGRMLLGLVGYDEYEEAVRNHHDKWPGWNDGGMAEVKELYKKLGA